jgi:hypothetical protein
VDPIGLHPPIYQLKIKPTAGFNIFDQKRNTDIRIKLNKYDINRK